MTYSVVKKVIPIVVEGTNASLHQYVLSLITDLWEDNHKYFPKDQNIVVKNQHLEYKEIYNTTNH